MVLCKVLCNVLGGTENDKSLVSTATFSDNLPPLEAAQGDNMRGPVAKTLQRCVLKTISWYFSKFDSGGDRVLSNLHDSMPPFTICQFGILINFSPQLSQVALRECQVIIVALT
jgi:hypothetical protein